MTYYRTFVISIRNWLKNFAEDASMPLDIQRYNMLWDMIQSIDKDLEDARKLDQKLNKEKKNDK